MRLLRSSRMIRPPFPTRLAIRPKDAKIAKVFHDDFQLFASTVDELTPVKGIGFMDMHGKNSSPQPETYIGYDLCGPSCYVLAYLLQRQGIEVSLGGTRDHVFLVHENEEGGDPVVVDPTYKQPLVDMPDCDKSTLASLPAIYIGTESELYDDITYIVSAVLDDKGPEKSSSMKPHYVALFRKKYNSQSAPVFPLNLMNLVTNRDTVPADPIVACVVDKLRDIEDQNLPNNSV